MAGAPVRPGGAAVRPTANSMVPINDRLTSTPAVLFAQIADVLERFRTRQGATRSGSSRTTERRPVKASAGLFRWLWGVLYGEPVFVGAAYVFTFVLAPLSRPVFRMIHIELAVDDRESLGIDRVLVAVLV
jgi:hypothetical protein